VGSKMTETDGITESKFNLWRALVSLVHADDVVTLQERDFFLERFQRMGLSFEQRISLQEDLTQPRDIRELLPQISEKHDRSALLYFARLLFWCDGDFAEEEKELFNYLQKEITGVVESSSMMLKVEQAVQQTVAPYEKKGTSSKADDLQLSVLNSAADFISEKSPFI